MSEAISCLAETAEYITRNLFIIWIAPNLSGYPLDYSLAGSGDSSAVRVDAGTHPGRPLKRETAVGVNLAIATNFAAVLAVCGLRQL
jgi:hypothetical protein